MLWKSIMYLIQEYISILFPIQGILASNKLCLESLNLTYSSNQIIVDHLNRKVKFNSSDIVLVSTDIFQFPWFAYTSTIWA